MSHRKAAVIGIFGNIFEWYDFSVYAYMATIIGKNFFNSADPRIGLLKAFFIFSISYLMRPVGSIFFGVLSDKYGRMFSLRWSLFLMGIPAFMIGLLPTYNSIGMFSVLLLVILRLIQGFGAGGELPGSACYVYETSENKYRNFFSSFVAASSMLGVLCGSLATFALFMFFSTSEVIQWAWRIPFLAGGLIIAFLYYIRSDIQSDKKEKKGSNPLLNLVKNEYRSIFKIMVLYSFISVTFYLLFVWMPSYLNVYLGISAKSSFLLGTLGLGFLILFTLFFGYISEIVGKKNLAVLSIVATMIAIFPAFMILSHKSLPLIFLVLLFFAFSLGCIDGVIMSIMGDLFSDDVRGTGISISFTFATAIFGGTAPTICIYIINKTGWLFSPAILLIIVCLIAIPVALSLEN